MARGDLGTIALPSAMGRMRSVRVGELLADTYPKSMGLLFLALLVAATVGVPLGVFSALRRHTPLSTGAMTLTLLGISVPSFTVAALLQVLEIHWFRRFGFRLVPVGGFGWDLHLVIPTLVLAARPLAQLARVAHMTFVDILDAPYMQTAHAKGLLKRIVLYRHAYPNAAVPLLTALGVSLRFSLSSLPVVEYLIGWPGIGAALLSAVRHRQAPGVAGMALALGLTFMLVNLLLDLLYRLVDPRLREGEVTL
jgi:peptide/nickel transport system permease protein